MKIIEAERWRFTDKDGHWQELHPLPLSARRQWRRDWQDLADAIENLRQPRWADIEAVALPLLAPLGVIKGVDFAIASQLLIGWLSADGWVNGLALLQNFPGSPTPLWPTAGNSFADIYDRDEYIRHAIDGMLNEWGLSPDNIDIETAYRLLLNDDDKAGLLFDLEFYDFGLDDATPLDDKAHRGANAYAAILAADTAPAGVPTVLNDVPWNPLQGALHLRAKAMEEAMEATGASGSKGSRGNPGGRSDNKKKRADTLKRYVKEDGSFNVEEYPDVAKSLDYMRGLRR